MYKMELNVRISTVSSSGSSTTSDLFQQDFSGKELLLLLRLQTDPELFESWKANVISGDSDEDYSLAVSAVVSEAIYKCVGDPKKNCRVVSLPYTMGPPCLPISLLIAHITRRNLVNLERREFLCAIYHCMTSFMHCALYCIQVKGNILQFYFYSTIIVYQRLPVTSSHSQVVTRSSRHTVNSSPVNLLHMLLITQSTHHKRAHNKAIS